MHQYQKLIISAIFKRNSMLPRKIIGLIMHDMDLLYKPSVPNYHTTAFQNFI